MARKRQEDPPAGAPAWMSTFSDLMNLLLCFFVLLYSMSSVDESKWEQVVASLQSTISILPAGGSAIGDGEMISAGVRQLEFLDSYYNEMANSKAEEDAQDPQNGKNSVYQAYQEQALEESEQMAQEIQEAINGTSLEDIVEVEFNSQYVQLNLSGAILFESGKAELVKEAYPTVDKIGRILERYAENTIEIEGHTDNVPISSSQFENNDVLSMYRALSVATYFRENTDLNPANIKSSGRGDYVPVADNSTAEGRARNRRVEIKIYNSYSSGTNE
ncbi:MAG: flagellar motor protein MotB [Agathobacter sp.]|nr:flagellar motor protein MotB [Agathobacter sp.]